MKKLLALSVWCFVLFSVNAFAYCMGGFPHFFSGTLTIDGEPAPAGTQIRASIQALIRGELTTTLEGEYDFLAVSGILYLK
jgi:hypothetical protein